MVDAMDDPTRRYVERAIELAEDREERLTAAELGEIAAEIGLTDEDLQRVEDELQAHAERGAGYARHRMWDDAIREFREVVAVAPDRPGMLMALAEAHASRFDVKRDPDDRATAEDLLREVLDLAPGHDEAYAVLAELEVRDARDDAPSSPGPAPAEIDVEQAKKRAIIIATLSVLTIGCSAFIVLLMVGEPQEGKERSGEGSTFAVKTVDEVKAPQTGDRDLELEFIENEQSKGLTFRSRKSLLSVYPERSYHRLWGDFEVTGGLLVEEIEATLELLDEGGNVVTSEKVDAWPSHQPALRTGDRGPFDKLTPTDARAQSARLSIVRTVSSPAGTDYPEVEPIDVSWVVKKPEHLTLEIRERKAAVSDPVFSMPGHFKGAWEFRNTGDHPVRTLKYTVRLFDGSDKEIAVDDDNIVTYSNFPPLLAGESALDSVISKVPEGYDRYTIEIVEIE